MKKIMTKVDLNAVFNRMADTRRGVITRRNIYRMYQTIPCGETVLEKLKDCWWSREREVVTRMLTGDYQAKYTPQFTTFYFFEGQMYITLPVFEQEEK